MFVSKKLILKKIHFTLPACGLLHLTHNNVGRLRRKYFNYVKHGCFIPSRRCHSVKIVSHVLIKITMQNLHFYGKLVRHEPKTLTSLKLF